MASNKAAQRRFNSSLSGAACKRGQFTCQACWISLVSLRSDNSSASTLVKVATFGGKIPKRQNFWTASNLELAFYRQLITTCTSGTIQKSRYLDISWQMAPTLQSSKIPKHAPYLHSNHRHRGSRIQSPSSTKHLRALFQETSKDTQRLDEIRLIHPGWLKYVGILEKKCYSTK